PFLAVLAVLMGMAPWPAGDEPHLMQKIRMLLDGTLTRPLDIFDLFAHGLPLVLLVVKTVRVVLKDEDVETPESGE
ncbi:MAG: hypothetical protein ACQEVA_21790, partial [Myxococcota bacterium]